MPASLWEDPGTWIALGVSALFVVVGWAMHRAIMKVLKGAPPSPSPSSLTSSSESNPPNE
jgi:hypothetical protein